MIVHHPLLSHLFVLSAWASIIGVWVDADAATGKEKPYHLNILGIHQPNEVFHNDVHAVLMKVAVITEREEVELQTLRLHHTLAGDVENLDFGEVGLAGDGAQRGELWAVELHPIIVIGVLILEGL